MTRVHAVVVIIFTLSQIISGQASNPDSKALIRAAGDGDIAKVKSLLDSGTSPDIKDDNGRTSVHMAAANGHQATAEVLIKHGAEINTLDNEQKTPLDYAVANEHSGLAQFLKERGAISGNNPQKIHRLKPSLKFKTTEEFEKEIREPSVFLDSEHICFFAPKRREKEARIVFSYLTKAYDELFSIVGVHAEYKIAVYAFPKGNKHGWGGTSNCSIEYDDSNLDFSKSPEWAEYKIPHISGYIEEMAHNFVHAAGVQFGWEMIGCSLGADVSKKLGNNPILAKQVDKTRAEQQKTYTRYIKNKCVLPSDIPANKCDRIHAWILFECEKKYGPDFWKDFFKEARKRAHLLKGSFQPSDDDAVRNARYKITIDCFDRLDGIDFKKRLIENEISVTTDIKSLHPEKPQWNRRLK